MTGESPDYACGQILFNLKRSNLHYLLEETHLSAYITIRKKFIKTPNETVKATVNNQGPSELEVELLTLRENNRDLETRLAMAKVEFEEKELEKQTLLTKLSNQDDEIEHFLKQERKLNENIKALTQEKDDLKVTIDEVENDMEELELKNGKLESDKSDLDDIVEELYREVSHLKLDKKNDDREQQLCKTKLNLKEASDTIAMLESTVMNGRTEIDSMKEKLNLFEIGTFKYSCEKCENIDTCKTNLNIHASEHTDEDLPSTSKCGTCNYESDDETDLQNHISSNHVKENQLNESQIKLKTASEDKAHKAKPDATAGVKCPECIYIAESNYYLEDHILDNHNFPCGNCTMIFRTLDRLEIHICKQEVKNPTFGSLYSKSWFDINGCNPVYCGSINQEIAWLHSERCWSKNQMCCVLQNKTEDSCEIHLELDKFIIYCVIQWEMLSKEVSTTHS